MTNVGKTIEKMKKQPNGIKPAEVEKVLYAYGYILRNQVGSHRQYKNLDTGDIITIPQRNPVKAVYIKDVIRIIIYKDKERD